MDKPKIVGSGSLRKVKNGWQIVLSEARDETGYRKQHKMTVRGTKAKAQQVMNEWRNELNSPAPLPEYLGVTFSEYAEKWHDGRCALGDLAPSTINCERYLLDHLEEYIGHIPMKQITASVVWDDVVVRHSEVASADGVRRVYRKLKQILQHAYVMDDIPVNPCNKVKPPKVGKPEIKYLDAKGIAKMLYSLDQEMQNCHNKFRPDEERRVFTHGHVMAVRLALATGLRRGETLGLVWSAIDFEAGTLQVFQQNTANGVRKPKTDKARRRIMLDSETIDLLQAWRIEQAAWLLKLGITQDYETPVFADLKGNFPDVNNFSAWWSDFCKRYEFNGLKFHQLRHTLVTQMFAAGVDIKTIQGRVGHSQASTTLDIYAEVMPDKDEEVARKMGDLLRKAQAQAEAMQI